MPYKRRFALIPLIFISSVVGCAPNTGGVRPTYPWDRQVPSATNPWAQPGVGLSPSTYSTTQSADSRRWSFLSDLMRRADQQESLAETQRRRIAEWRVLQRERDQSERLYVQQQRLRERDALAKKYTNQENEMRGRMDQLQGRANDLDTNNRDLHSQLARAQQQRGVLEDEVDLLKQRLTDTSRQLAQSRQSGQEADRRIQALQASVRRRAGASITANSSLNRGITAVMVPGMNIRQDNDLVRISIPSDKLFMAGTAALHQGSQPYLDQVARVILENYPRQIVGVEAHSDHATTLANTQWRNQHQLTAAQSTAVFEQLTTRKINPHQLFVLGHGGNHPLVSAGTPEGQSLNRRIEVVIYPETYPR